MDNKFKRYLPFTLCLMGALLIISLLCINNDQQVDLPKHTGEIDTVKVDFGRPKFTKEALKKELIKQDIKKHDIVYAQARLETGNFKSKLFVENNNLFGFRCSSGWRKYPHWIESVEAYSRFQKEYYKGGDYYIFLTRVRYAEDTNYIKKLKRCQN